MGNLMSPLRYYHLLTLFCLVERLSYEAMNDFKSLVNHPEEITVALSDNITLETAKAFPSFPAKHYEVNAGGTDLIITDEQADTQLAWVAGIANTTDGGLLLHLNLSNPIEKTTLVREKPRVSYHFIRLPSQKKKLS